MMCIEMKTPWRLRGALKYLRLLSAVWLVVVASGCGDAEERGLRDLNIVLIVIDTLRLDRTPVNDPSVEGMPFLAELAKRSVVFERTYSTSSYTAPATASMFTSRYPSDHGVWNGFSATQRKGFPLNRIPFALETLPELLSRAGYRTFGVSDNINIGEPMGFADGFDRFAHFEYASASVVNETVEGWAEEIRSGGKYFLYLHYMDPHRPYHPRAKWQREGSTEEHVGHLKSWGKTTPEQQARVGQTLSAYDSELSYLDEHLRKLYDLLQWQRDTVVVVTADHGEEFFDHGGEGHPFSVYEELVRVPMLFSIPGEKPRRIRELASLLDMLPTLRNVAGMPWQAADVGESLLPVIHGEHGLDRSLYAMRLSNWEGEAEPRAVYAVIDGDWKYILALPSAEEELYDLTADPAEQRNALGENEEIARGLARKLSEIRSQVATSPRSFIEAPELSSEMQEHLRALGYGE
jgi:arylsulfatase A-like enzyme